MSPYASAHGFRTSKQKDEFSNATRRVARIVIEIAVAAFGVTLLICALGANQGWLDRHFLPSFFLPRLWYVAIQTSARVGLGVLGAWLLWAARPRLGQIAMRAPADIAGVAIAVILALGAGEFALQHLHLQSAGWLSPEEEPRRMPDQRLGWRLVPTRTARYTIGGREIEYTLDPSGYRVRTADASVDAARPTIIFTGESVMFGEGLTWEESIPAQVGALTDVQTANLAVHGYGNDQAYQRLVEELPRFQRPVAIVSLFMTALFGRNLQDDRPHLDPGLVWVSARQRGRLQGLLMVFAPYRTDAAVERGVRMTRDVLRATIDMARTRGATPIVVVPQLGPEADVERVLRTRILDEGSIPYVWVLIDGAWRLPWDRHPNALAAHAIAAAIASRLLSPAS